MSRSVNDQSTKVANWPMLFAEMPKAIDQLEAHDAHNAYEAAVCLRMALGFLTQFNRVRAYDFFLQELETLVRLREHGHADDARDALAAIANTLSQLEIAATWECDARALDWLTAA